MYSCFLLVTEFVDLGDLQSFLRVHNELPCDCGTQIVAEIALAIGKCIETFPNFCVHSGISCLTNKVFYEASLGGNISRAC